MCALCDVARADGTFAEMAAAARKLARENLEKDASRARMAALTLRTAAGEHPTLGADMVTLVDDLEKIAQRSIELADGLLKSVEGPQ